MKDFLFDDVYSWCLLDELLLSGLMPEMPAGTYAGEERLAAHRGGQLTPQNRQIAREMFVCADRVLLPGKFDVPLPTNFKEEGHITWWNYANEELDKVRWSMGMDRYRYREIGVLAPLILPPGDGAAEHDLSRLLKWWENLEVWEEKTRARVDGETWKLIDNVFRDDSPMREVLYSRLPDQAVKIKKLLSDDPLSLKSEFDPIYNRFKADIGLITEASLVAAHGIPTLHSMLRGPKRGSGASPNDNFLQGVEAEKGLGVVSLYFENVVRCPTPETIKDALRLRENPSIEAWRGQTTRWTSQLVDGTIDLGEIKEQIKDANGYIEGAQFPSRILPRFMPFITLPLAIAAKVYELAPVEWLLIGLEGFHIYGEVISKATLSPNRLEHKWLMLSNKSE